jgi:uncharacterized iron-regulated membrane protein
MTLRKFIGKMHLWLGLSSGLVVFIIAITGCLYAFQDEIKNLTQPYRFVERQDRPFLPPSELKHRAEQALPQKHVHAIMYQGAVHAAKVIFYSEQDDYYFFVYINQYTSEVLKVKDEFNDFFRFVLDGHYYLWLPHELGHTVVACATLIFFVMVLSGLFLWWPRNKAGRKQRFSIKWDARWRRKNYDLHNVMGFYVLFFALVFAITGLVWGFEWFSKTYYAVISGGDEMKQYQQPVSGKMKLNAADLPAIDKVWLRLQPEVPERGSIEVHTPETDSSSIAVNINPDPATYWKTDYRYFDQYDLRELSVDHIWGRYHAANASEKLMRMNYDIHVGAALGLPGKILAFCASLVIASLPVTGTIIWWGRRKKAK